jgi:sigma-E factor negative regulatory protein RseA
MMSEQLERGSNAARQRLSDLMDGRAEPGQVDAACAAWQDDPNARECWHTYHLIGDVLRSDELAATPTADAAFVRALRERLATEPVPLPRRPLARHIPRWPAASVAAVAGVAAVFGVVAVLRSGAPGLASDAGTGIAAVAPPAQVALSGKLVRDAELDRYLTTHRRVGGNSAMLVPGAVVRSVDTIAIDDR